MLGWKIQMRFKVMMNKIIHFFLEGGSVTCKEQNIVTDGVLFIEDKLTSLEFDNAGNQTSPSDEEFEWNDDNAVVSNDAKHMKKKQPKMLLSKMKMMMIAVISLNYPQPCYNLKLNHLTSLNYLHLIVIYSVQPELLMRQKQTRNK